MAMTNTSCLMSFVLFLCISLNINFSSGSDTITASGSLSGDQTIVSSDGTFELGFVKPGKSSNYYIGMWYSKLIDQRGQTLVWVANRETPVHDKYSSELKIIGGNLVLLNDSKNPVWSTNLTSNSAVAAVLLDDGNLVLRGGSDGSSSTPPLWQSFDNPTHTLLPGTKLGYNNRTSTKQLVISWKNSEDPAPGLYSLELDPYAREYIIRWNRSEQSWTSGPWNGEIFAFLPEMKLNFVYYNFSYVSNENESYFTYSIYNPATISRFILDYSGQIKQLTWLDSSKEWNLFLSQPRQQCDVYAYCGGFGTCNQNSLPICNCAPGFMPKLENDWNLSDYSSGCARRTELQCGSTRRANGKRDKFFMSSHMGLPLHSQSIAAGSAAECESICLSNCSCTAYSYDGGCSVWNGDLLNMRQLSEDDGTGKTIYIRLAASEFSGSKTNTGIVIGAVVGSVVVVLDFLGIVFIVIHRRRKRLAGTSKAVEGSVVAFAYKDLQNVTKNFSEKLGGGCFGSVFKGTFLDSTTIAVKKLEVICQSEKQFRMGVSTIGTIQHVNLVRLRGFCSEGHMKFLVYDYVPNRSLDVHLFQEKDAKVLDWKTRYQIALGTAKGLFYLHERSRNCIIHCDIKAENILLDSDFSPKVADFCLAMLIGQEFCRVLATAREIRGYLAPECMSGVAITAKADVYSYGMMLFEIISGRRNSKQLEDGKVRFFPSWAASVTIEGGDVLSLLDRRLGRAADADEVTRLCRVACWCIQDDENSRPSMGLVVKILEGILDVNIPPAPRSAQAVFDSWDDIVFLTESSNNCSES